MLRRKRIAIFELDKPRKVKIHTWFLLYRINIDFYDKDLNLLKSTFNIKPFSSGILSPKETKYIIEIPSNNL